MSLFNTKEKCISSSQGSYSKSRNEFSKTPTSENELVSSTFQKFGFKKSKKFKLKQELTKTRQKDNGIRL